MTALQNAISILSPIWWTVLTIRAVRRLKRVDRLLAEAARQNSQAQANALRARLQLRQAAYQASCGTPVRRAASRTPRAPV